MSYELHGGTGTRLYRIWKSMKCRCTNSNHPTYPGYGGRGITIYNDWLRSYSVFREWALSHGYSNGLELERINVDGNYCPENCTWITHHEQTLNRRDTLYIIVGEDKTRFMDYCIKHKINLNTVRGWRAKGILEQKLSERLGTSVKITGGQREKVMPK